ncbi:type VII secretion system-associated protein [Kutzneria chonburiensis]|uniref:Type VII secretion system-associated protein n=1 Tax=Kutzneria chonburiensis TaxID=1483604 RepID=A0ABV6N0P9_9PSEU|nr:type VII secretion system-associated protein [Kutzneria chonburiensis]
MSSDQWLFLVDPAWQAAEDGQNPPAGSVVGGWLVTDGVVGRFEPNPDYEPLTPESPTDPVDAALRMAADGEVDSDALFAVIRESEFGVALDEHQRPLIAPAPDDVLSLLVTTAPAHRGRVRAEAWQVVNAAELAGMLAEHEVDALVNPGATTSTRLLASTIADAAVHPAG